MTVAFKHYIDGRWLTGGGEQLTSGNPARYEHVVAEGMQATSHNLDEAVNSASAASAEWRSASTHERARYLETASWIIDAEATDLGYELAVEVGKTWAEGTAEVRRSAKILRYFASQADQASGEMYNSPRRGERILVSSRPLGVVGVITPFNFPIAIPAWKIAPALLYGNTVVWKPASTVPLLAMRFAEAFDRAGLPAGVLNMLSGPGQLGSELAKHAELDGLTFTGSTYVGQQLAGIASARGLPFQAELGGKNAAVVLADADLDHASERIMYGAFASTGQKCTATSRLIVVDSVIDEFLDLLGKRLNDWKVGDPTDSAVQMGPLITEAARRNIQSGIEASIADGATPVLDASLSGAYRDGVDLEQGAFIAPKILTVPSSANSLWSNELFGPVLALQPAQSVQHAFDLANETDYGLSASVFTRDMGNTLDAIENIRVGMLHINSETTGAEPHVPFGGVKKSSYGPKEQGQAAKEFYTETTTVYLSA